MRQIEIPALNFSPWYAWDARRTVPQGNMPGVYLLSISRKNLAGCTTDWPDVSYIGMTNSRQRLRGRWQQFFNSIRGMNGHSGGKAVYRALGHYDHWEPRLFVAAMPVICNVANPTDDDLIKMGWVAYLEYEAFAEYCRHPQNRCKPEYNTR